VQNLANYRMTIERPGLFKRKAEGCTGEVVLADEIKVPLFKPAASPYIRCYRAPEEVFLGLAYSFLSAERRKDGNRQDGIVAYIVFSREWKGKSPPRTMPYIVVCGSLNGRSRGGGVRTKKSSVNYLNTALRGGGVRKLEKVKKKNLRKNEEKKAGRKAVCSASSSRGGGKGMGQKERAGEDMGGKPTKGGRKKNGPGGNQGTKQERGRGKSVDRTQLPTFGMGLNRKEEKNGIVT